MNKYLAITRNALLSQMAHRGEFFFTSGTNLIFILLIYYIWQSIYSATPSSLNGMTFNDTFVYLSLASSLFIIFMTWTEWFTSNLIITGDIIKHLVRPLNFQLFQLSYSLGVVTFKLITISIPTFILIFFIFQTEIAIGANLLFFIPSAILAFLISFHLDYMVGLTAFYTESIWGISVTKEAVVLLLSGALIPIPFFPESMQKILMVLPFQSMYNTPLSILISDGTSIEEYLIKLLIQCFWVTIFFFGSMFYFSRAVRVLTVAGG